MQINHIGDSGVFGFVVLKRRQKVTAKKNETGREKIQCFPFSASAVKPHLAFVPSSIVSASLVCIADEAL